MWRVGDEATCHKGNSFLTRGDNALEEEYGELGEGSAGRPDGAGRWKCELGGNASSGVRLRLGKDESKELGKGQSLPGRRDDVCKAF